MTTGPIEGGELRFEGVWFAYPSRPSTWVLRGVDLHVTPGKKVRGLSNARQPWHREKM
jgi:ABC-type multidrug transport system fused ATPase/permease subunit